jgi:hypothetical protein
VTSETDDPLIVERYEETFASHAAGGAKMIQAAAA